MGRDRFSFAHLADAHVGAWARNPELRGRLRAAVVRAIELAGEREVDFLLISGDLFHTPDPEPAEVAPVAAALRRFVASGRRVYAIYGSHDYVAHRTSWLDVLAEAGIFVRVAPESVRPEGEAWTLPWLVDEPTGARIAGVSGRSHGLDRDYYRSMDASGFRDSGGFRIFQFHAAVEDFLPASLRDKVRGVRREELPAGVDYYAGGHIHATYTGSGPGGGLLVNPGAVFGTSRTDLEIGEAAGSHRGVVIVTVEGGRPAAEFLDVVRPGDIVSLDVDVTGLTSDAVPERIAARIRGSAPVAGALVLPRLRGVLAGGRLTSKEFGAVAEDVRSAGLTVQIDVSSLGENSPAPGVPVTESTIESEEIHRLVDVASHPPDWLDPTTGPRLVQELLRELGTPKAEGQSNLDYASLRRTGARRLLGAPETSTG